MPVWEGKTTTNMDLFVYLMIFIRVGLYNLKCFSFMMLSNYKDTVLLQCKSFVLLTKV